MCLNFLLNSWSKMWEHLKPGSSPVDWCEGNYQVSANIAEFVNTVSCNTKTGISSHFAFWLLFSVQMFMFVCCFKYYILSNNLKNCNMKCPLTIYIQNTYYDIYIVLSTGWVYALIYLNNECNKMRVETS